MVPRPAAPAYRSRMRKMLLVLFLAACGPKILDTPPDAAPADAAPGAPDADVCGTCAFPRLCTSAGCVDCDPSLINTCVGDEVHACNGDGTVGGLVTTCALESCSYGQCTDPCSAAAQRKSYLGCDYWPVDLDNDSDVFGQPIPVTGMECAVYSSPGTTTHMTIETIDVCPGSYQGGNDGFCNYGGDCSDAEGGTCTPMELCVLDAQHSPFAIVVSNPDDANTTNVTLSNLAGQSYTTAVPPGAVVPIFPQDVGFPDASLLYSGTDGKAYHLVSDRPIVAYQFNPLANVNVFSNDASLLLPSHTFDTKYIVSTWPSQKRRPARHDANGYVTVVAARPGTTNVTVTPTCVVRQGSGVPTLPAGVPHTFALTQWSTLNLEAVANGDLTGTVVESDQPVGAFAGHQATQLSQNAPAPCCMDHLEDQLFPASSWGKVYAVARSQSRGTGEPDLLRIVAQKPNTLLTFDPPVVSCPSALGAGQHCDVWIQGDVTVTGSEPIQVAHYLVGTGGVMPDSGDPALAFSVPIEQYRDDYTFLVPPDYHFDYVSLVVPAGGTVALDGVDVTAQLVPIGGGAYQGGRILVDEGQHKIVCPLSCGALVYGWSDAVSYLYAAGLDLKQIVVP